MVGLRTCMTVQATGEKIRIPLRHCCITVYDTKYSYRTVNESVAFSRVSANAVCAVAVQLFIDSNVAFLFVCAKVSYAGYEMRIRTICGLIKVSDCEYVKLTGQHTRVRMFFGIVLHDTVCFEIVAKIVVWEFVLFLLFFSKILRINSETCALFRNWKNVKRKCIFLGVFSIFEE